MRTRRSTDASAVQIRMAIRQEVHPLLFDSIARLKAGQQRREHLLALCYLGLAASGAGPERTAAVPGRPGEPAQPAPLGSEMLMADDEFADAFP